MDRVYVEDQVAGVVIDFVDIPGHPGFAAHDVDGGLVLLIGSAAVSPRVGDAHAAGLIHVREEALTDDLGVEEPVAGEVGALPAHRGSIGTVAGGREVGDAAEVQVVNQPGRGSDIKVIEFTIKNIIIKIKIKYK